MLEETDTESAYAESNYAQSYRTNSSSSSNSSNVSGLMQLAAATAASGSGGDVHHKVFDTASSAYTPSTERTNSCKTGGESGMFISLSNPTALPSTPQAPPFNERDKSPLILEFLREKGICVATLGEVDPQIMLDMIPKDDKGRLTSMGALLHLSGNCAPCLFYIKTPPNCNKSWQCRYCHFSHKGVKSKKMRPSKSTRLQLREQARLDGEPNSLQTQPDQETVSTNCQNDEDTPFVVDSAQCSRGRPKNLVSL